MGVCSISRPGAQCSPQSSGRWAKAAFVVWAFCSGLLLLFLSRALAADDFLDMGLSKEDYQENTVPQGWTLRRWPGQAAGASAQWTIDDGVHAVRLHSKATLTFLEKTVRIDIKDYPVVSWRWKVENILSGIDERTKEGDDHPIRIFFVFEPDRAEQSLGFRLRRFIYLDRVHGHPFGGRFTEYLWSSHLEAEEIINDPGKAWQKLMVVEGGSSKLNQWLSYRRNLYQDFKALYDEEPRDLIFVGILNDTDQSRQEATSYVADLKFSKN
jgi:hypothetical protein